MKLRSQSSRYVSPVPELTQLQQERMIEEQIQFSMHGFSRHVLNPLLQNVFFGVGVALVWRFGPELIALKWGWEFNSSVLSKASIFGGIIAFGLICILRFAHDEVSMIVGSILAKLYEIKLGHDITSTVDMYEGRLAQQQAYIKDLKAQLEILGGVRIHQPLTNADIAQRKVLAVKLYTRLINNLPIGRDECLRVKAFDSRNDWFTARQYLMNAGILDAQGKVLPNAAARGIALIEGYADTLQATRGKG
jgi:hypothetical protein